jgi:inner membrane protein
LQADPRDDSLDDARPGDFAIDTLTHGLAGALLGRAGSGARSVRAVVATAAIAAMFPDLDAFFLPGSWFRLGDRMSYLRYHRGITHSFLLAPLFAAGLALLVRAFARRTSLAALFAAALAGIVSHILFDWITSYGTMFFAPLSWRRYSLDWVFILDPFFTGIPVAALVASLFVRRRPQLVGILGAAGLLAYVGFCAAMHRRALGSARRLFPAADVAALPQPLSPLRWMLVADRGGEMDVAYVRLGGGAPPPAAAGGRPPGILQRLRSAYAAPASAPIERFGTGDGDRRVVASGRFADVAAWRRFARFPVAGVEALPDGGSRLTFTDLRFRGPWGRPAFQYEVLMSADERERASGFVRLFVTQDETRRR